MMEIFEEELKKTLPKISSFHPHFEKSLHKMLLAGGKRFRPSLLLNTVKAYEPRLLRNALYPALAVEYIHTYSLIHDDLPLMDNAPLRRGEETLHITYDEVTALLAGDGLNTHAFYLLSKSSLEPSVIVRLMQILSANAGVYGMVHGQALDCFFENKNLNIEEIKKLHTQKTGALIAASLQMGAVIANLDEELIEKIYNFGIELGLLFQIEDDIIDVTKDEKEAGKTINNDKDKNSFVNLLGLDGAIEYKNNLKNKLNQSAKESFNEEFFNFLQIILKKF